MTTPHVPVLSYAEVRPLLCSGDILLCSGTAFFSRLIQRSTGSPYSHVGLFWRNEEADRIMVYESVESKGVINNPFSRYLGNYKGEGKPYPGQAYIARHAGFTHLTPRERRTFLQFAIDVQGHDYDSQEIARIAVSIAAPSLAWDPTFPEVTAGTCYICSVYAGATLQTVNLDIPHDPRGFLAPADFANAPAVDILWEVQL